MGGGVRRRPVTDEELSGCSGGVLGGGCSRLGHCSRAKTAHMDKGRGSLRWGSSMAHRRHGAEQRR
jgi:hypothetical protein